MGSFVCKSAFVSLWIVSLCKIDYLFQFIITICIQIFFFLRTFISLTYSMVSHMYYFDREGKNAGTHVHEGAHGLIHGVVYICLGFSCVRLGSCLISYLLFNWTRSRAHTLRLTHCVLHTAAKLVRTKFCFSLFFFALSRFTHLLMLLSLNVSRSLFHFSFHFGLSKQLKCFVFTSIWLLCGVRRTVLFRFVYIELKIYSIC